MAKVGRPTKYDPKFCDRVIEMGKYGASKAEMALTLDVALSSFKLWEQQHEEFSAAVKKATELSQGWWERVGRQATIGEVEGFNATSFIFNMKNRFKEDWRDKVETDNKHDVSDPMKELLGYVAGNGKRVGEK